VFPPFTVKGRIYGNRQGRAASFDKGRMDYKKQIRYLANLEGIPNLIKEGERARVDVLISWRNTQRVDWLNVVKLVEDSLFENDRKCWPGQNKVIEGAKREYIIVGVRVEPIGLKGSRAAED